MSAFLGPIHSLMYSRIITMQQVINCLADLAKAKGWDADVSSFVIDEFPPIEEVIDLSNIHMSLFQMVEGAKRRFAGIVAAVLSEHPERIEEVATAVKAAGSSIIIEDVTTAEDACAFLEELLLDGMPCDRATMVVGDGDSCRIVRNIDLHSSYFEAAGLDGDMYYQLLKEFVGGVFADSAVEVSGDFREQIVLSLKSS